MPWDLEYTISESIFYVLYLSTTNKSSRSAEGLRARMYAPAHGQVNNSSKANFPIKTTNVDCEQDYLPCVEFIDKLSQTLYSSNQVNDRQRSSLLAQWVWKSPSGAKGQLHVGSVVPLLCCPAKLITNKTNWSFNIIFNISP